MTEEPAAASRFKPIPIAIGLGVAALFAFVDSPLHHQAGVGSRPAMAAAVASLMAIWWLTEAVPIYWTACLPVVLYPLLGVFGEPVTSQVLAGLAPAGGHRIEGTGAGFVPSIYRADLADAVVPVADSDAFATARRLAREEGIFGGTSSGANVWIALQRAGQLPPGARIVTTVCDSGLKYLRGDLYR